MDNTSFICIGYTIFVSFLSTALILNKIKSIWLFCFFIFNIQAFRPKNNYLSEHIRQFKKEIIQSFTENYDEIIITAHSNGSIVLIPLLYSLKEHFSEEILSKVKILTLGHCIPLTSYFKDAKNFYRQLNILKNYPLIWCDLSSPADSVCFSQHDPFHPNSSPKKTKIFMKSPQFHKYMYLEKYKITPR